MNNRILINGHEQTSVDVRDRGLQYGDGLFETMAVVDGRIRRLELHLQRLRRGCERLGIPFPEQALLESELAGLARDRPRAVLKLILTRGLGGRGYRPPAEPAPTRIVWLDAWPEYPREWWEEGVEVRLCRTVLGRNPVLAGIKHLNRLEQVLARREWDTPSIPEGILLDASGSVVCGTMTNLFVVRGGILRTPRLDRCGVAGTVRQAVLAAARSLQMQVEETTIKLADAWQAEELFLTNALIGIWPVRRFEGNTYSVGQIARQLQAALDGGFSGATAD